MADDNGYSYLQSRLANLERRINSMEGEIAAGLNNVAQVIQRGTMETVTSIQRSSEVNGRAEIAKQIAQLNAVTPLIKAQVQALNDEIEGHIRPKIESIGIKYDLIEQQLNESYLRDLRRLGAHIYDILENDFSNGIEHRYSRSGYGLLSKSVSGINQYRSTSISEHLERTFGKLVSFTKRRETFRQGVASKLINCSDTLLGKTVAIPFWLITTKDKNGVISTVLIPPGKIASKKNGVTKISIERDEDFTDIANIINKQLDQIIKESPAKTTDPTTMESLRKGLRFLNRPGNGEIKSSLMNLISKDLSKRRNEKRPISISI